MTTPFEHEKLDVYQATLELITWTERYVRNASPTINARDHLHRAAESIARNIVRANGRSSRLERSSILDIAYGSALESAACLDVLYVWKALARDKATEGKQLLNRIVSMLVRLRVVTCACARESFPSYGEQQADVPLFSHERLHVYQAALRFVNWCAETILTPSIGLSRGRDLDRQATCMVLNIAEGNGKFSLSDRQRFLRISLNASLQAASSLDILTARGTISCARAQTGKGHLATLAPMMRGLIRSLTDRPPARES